MYEGVEKVGGAKASFRARNRQLLQLDSPTVTRGIRPQMPGLMRCRVRVGVGVGEAAVPSWKRKPPGYKSLLTVDRRLWIVCYTGLRSR